MDNSQFFSGIKPNLINEKALKSISKILDESTIYNQPTTGENLLKLYENYIKPNMFGLLVIVIISIFLFIRYIIKKYNESTDIEIDLNEEVSQNNQKKENNKNIENVENNAYKNNKSDDEFTLDGCETETNENKENKEKSLDNGESRFTELNEEYNRTVKENMGLMSEQAIKDIYKKKKDKLTFDELTRIIVEGCQ
jgi:hypothetical protein